MVRKGFKRKEKRHFECASVDEWSENGKGFTNKR
jgi:hypothetical protein